MINNLLVNNYKNMEEIGVNIINKIFYESEIKEIIASSQNYEECYYFVYEKDGMQLMEFTTCKELAQENKGELIDYQDLNAFDMDDTDFNSKLVRVAQGFAFFITRSIGCDNILGEEEYESEWVLV